MEVGGLVFDFSIVKSVLIFQETQMNAVILFMPGGYFGDL